MQTNRSFLLTLSGLLGAVAVGIVILAIIKNNTTLIPIGNKPTLFPKSSLSTPFGKMEKFKTDAEFTEYMQNNQSQSSYGGFSLMQGARMEKSLSTNAPGDSTIGMPVSGGGEPSRVSQTNVQVIGIDEPDIVKTNGDSIFYSQPLNNYVPMMLEKRVNDPQIGMMPIIEPPISGFPPIPPTPVGGIASIKSFPPGSMAKQGGIPVSGDLLLAKNVLVVFNEDNYNKRSIDGYDVSNPSLPKKKWSISYKNNTYKIQARLYQNKLYLITRLDMGGGTPCPLKLFDINGTSGIVPCTGIYRPTTHVATDTVYTISMINSADGTVEKNVSFVGSTNDSTIYMSKDSIYVAYYYSGDLTKIMYSFVSQNSDLYPAYIVEKLAKLQTYDISDQAKMIELSTLLSKLTMGMDDDKRLAYENNVQNRMKSFMKDHARELEKTGIVKVDVNNFNVEATGDVPGKVLNQFSMDEYKGNLRIATTVGQNSWFGNFGQLTQSFSDVYVLNSNMETIGSVPDLGKSERIYSVRFIADRGYVVTFRQTDPFYVIDLSNPSNPALKGELKIPGYSGYLHPLTLTMLVGVGKEGNNVKLSLFDVSDAQNPLEIDKFNTTEYWSEALTNHHAFLADEEHQVIFMPGNQGGYVFSYKGNKLSMVRAVADMQIQRAVYINNYLYIIGQNKIVVLDENTWEKAGELLL